MSENSNFYEMVMNSLLTKYSCRDYFNKFRQLRTDEERFLSQLKLVVRKCASFLDAPYKQKNSGHSIKSREDGNESFRKSQYYKAVQQYTESIVYAIDSSEELALAYANRSAALFELKKYAACIDDIDRALSPKFPDRLKTKLFKRKGLCLNRLGMSGAESAFQEALLWVDKMNLSRGDMNKSRDELMELISASSVVIQPPEKMKQPPLPGISSPNPEVPCASEAVAIRYTTKFGRHIVATRKIKAGEILVIEKPYCVGLIPTHIYTHCSCCLEVSWSLIPCKCCVNVAYCSEACRDDAWKKYHEVECLVLGFMRITKYNEPLEVSLKMTLMATNKGQNLDSVKQEMTNVNHNKDPRTKGFGDDGKFHSDKYRSVYSLLDNLDKISAEELAYRTLSVAITVCILARKSNVFGKKLELHTLEKNPDVIFVGGLILKNYHICCINMHSFGAARAVNASEHGHALMTLCSLFNHSCNPNVYRQWYAGHMVLFALYPIAQGEQVFETYGAYFDTMIKSERQNFIRYWNFHCECTPCIDDWPPCADLPSFEEQPLTQEIKNKVENALQIFYTYDAFSSGTNSVGNMLQMLDLLLGSIELLFNLPQQPCIELHALVGQLKEFYQSADGVYEYETTNNPSLINKLHSIFNRSLQHKLSQK